MPGKDEEIKVRVPGAMKSAIKALASKRFTSESEIAREALLEYLRTRNIELHEDPVAYKTESEISSARQEAIGDEALKVAKGALKKSKTKRTPKTGASAAS